MLPIKPVKLISGDRFIIRHSFAYMLMILPMPFSTLTRAVHSKLAFAFENILHLASLFATIAPISLRCAVFQFVTQILETVACTASVKEFYQFTWAGV